MSDATGLSSPQCLNWDATPEGPNSDGYWRCGECPVCLSGRGTSPHDPLCDSRKDPETGPYLPCNCASGQIAEGLVATPTDQSQVYRCSLLDEHDPHWWGTDYCGGYCPGIAGRTLSSTEEAAMSGDCQPSGNPSLPSQAEGEGFQKDMRYATLVVDPPWPQKAGGPLRGGHGEGFVGTAGSLPMPYSTMSVENIKALPVGRVAAPDAHLYLWTTNRFLPDAYAVATAWGFKPSTLLVWAKKPIGAGLGGCYGIATEYVLFARRGKLPALSRVGRNHWDWKRPYLNGKPQHSAKPPDFFRMVEQVSPDPRIELFARTARPGWDAWGDQAPAPVALPTFGGAA